MLYWIWYCIKVEERIEVSSSWSSDCKLLHPRKESHDLNLSSRIKEALNTSAVPSQYLWVLTFILVGCQVWLLLTQYNF